MKEISRSFHTLARLDRVWAGQRDRQSAIAHLKVFDGLDADGKPILLGPDHAPTMHELMSHAAGFTYGLSGSTHDIVFIGMIQRMGMGPAMINLPYESRAVVYGALVDPVK